MSDGSELFRRASAEIAAFHRFFVEWYDAVTANDVAFDRCESAFGREFHMIPPSGRIFDRGETIELIRSNRASYNGDFSIEIEDIRPCWEAGDAIMVTYVEAQVRSGAKSRRQASALFTLSSSAPEGVEWQHLQETWLQMPES
jgi:hypothetical protein